MATVQSSSEVLRCTERAVECRPFLKWAGGKSRLLNDVTANLPKSFNRYFEPFLGGGAVFFTLQPGQAVLSDVNEQLINTFTIVRDQVDALIAELAKHKHNRRYYYRMRSADRQNDFWVWSPVEKASRLIYLNKTCFNGLYRVNARGHFNVPFGDYKKPAILDETNLRACSTVLQGAELRVGSFDAAVADAKKGDLVYFDPPYVPLSSTASFAAYAQGGFTLEEHVRLRKVVDELTAKGVYVLLSNSSAPFVVDLYKDLDLRYVESARAINSKGDKRGKVKEVLVKNY